MFFFIFYVLTGNHSFDCLHFCLFVLLNTFYNIIVSFFSHFFIFISISIESRIFVARSMCIKYKQFKRERAPKASQLPLCIFLFIPFCNGYCLMWPNDSLISQLFWLLFACSDRCQTYRPKGKNKTRKRFKMKSLCHLPSILRDNFPLN